MNLLYFIAFFGTGIGLACATYRPMDTRVTYLAVVVYLLGGWVSTVVIHSDIPTAMLGAILIMNFCHAIIVFANYLVSQMPLAPLDIEQIHEYTD